MYQICTCDYKILYLVHMTGQYSDSLFHCCLPSASLERNLVTRSHTYSALFLLWDHIQSMCFCMCCITEVCQQCSFNNNFSGKSNRLIMKQGETSKQRQLGGRKEISCHSKECQDIFLAKFREQWLHNSNRRWFETNKLWCSPGTDIKMWLMSFRKISWIWTNWKFPGAKKRNHLRWLLSSTSRTCWYALRVVDCT